MSEEPDPEQLIQEPKPFNSVAYWLFGVGIFLFVSFLSTPLVIRSAVKSPRTEATSNAKQIGLALYSFEDEYGSYPNESTVALINENNPDSVYDCSGKSSNAAFRQLMKTEITESEQMFYAKIKGSVKPDGIIIPSEALKKGEVGFSYISGVSTKDDPATPLILTPLIPGTTKFDPKPFDGTAIILHIDQSVSRHVIHKDGHVYDKDGDILSSEHPIWKGKAPDIRYPE